MKLFGCQLVAIALWLATRIAWLSVDVVPLLVAANANEDIKSKNFNPNQMHLSDFTLDYIHRSKYLFQQKFEDKCLKYPFVQHYLRLNDPKTYAHDPDSRKYLVYVFHNAKGNIGGLGDRFAGIITGFAFALRSNRTFLLYGDRPVEDYFQPYQLANDTKDYSWSSWKWANYESHFGSDLDDLVCVNPKRPGNCHLDESWLFKKKVMRFVSNRNHLCRWAVRDKFPAFQEVSSLLGINRETNLYEAAGCLMRLVLHPTDKLWRDLARFIDHLMFHHHHHHKSNNSTSSTTATTAASSPPAKEVHHIEKTDFKAPPPVEKKMMQVGFHFRCGDGQMFGQADAPPCVVEPGIPWKPILFSDETSPDSPVDISTCAIQAFDNLTKSSVDPLYSKIAFIASDNKTSASQMDHNPKKNWLQTFMPQQACHVDGNGDLCGHITWLQWFALSLSDIVVAQSFPLHLKNANEDWPEFLQALQDPFPVQSYPASAFSRYASVYGFAKLRYGSQCADVNTTTLGHHSHSNWRCDPKVFL